VPADDRSWTHDYNCIVPIEQTGEKREPDPRCSINAPRLDASLNVLRELLSED
jgi:hypothetical protein